MVLFKIYTTINIYFKILLETSYIGIYAKITEFFISTLYQMLFDIDAP